MSDKVSYKKYLAMEVQLMALIMLCDQYADEDDEMFFREWKREYLAIRARAKEDKHE